MKKGNLTILASLVLIFQLSACNNLFYRPSSEMNATPSAVGLEFQDLYFKSGDEELNAWFLEAVPL